MPATQVVEKFEFGGYDFAIENCNGTVSLFEVHEHYLGGLVYNCLYEGNYEGCIKRKKLIEEFFKED